MSGVAAWLDELVLPPGWRIHKAGPWTVFIAPAGGSRTVSQGWKLHVAARSDMLQRTVDVALPVLFDEGCEFKVVCDAATMSAFNGGMYGTGAVGKAITVYPDPARVEVVAHRLADVVTGFAAPRVPSDRKVRHDAPVYYRFGPFLPRVRTNGGGYVEVVVEAPDGGLESGQAGETYLAPSWAVDPFDGRSARGTTLPRVDGAPVIGDHYRIVGVITRAADGDTYRAVDLRTGRAVVVKGAHAFVNETTNGDARTYLRHELGILRVLEDVDQVPDVVDHFAYGDDEYLVTTDLGADDLRSDVIECGIFDCSASPGRSVGALTQSLVRVLDAIHARGVVFRDLAPQNIVPMGGGRWGLVDFELSRFNGVQRFGWTPAYSGAAQRTNRAATPADDQFSLGAVIFYAVMGMDPVVVNGGLSDGAARIVNVEQTMRCLASVYGDTGPLTQLVGALLSGNAAQRARAVARLRVSADLSDRLVAAGDRPRATRGPSLGPLLRGTVDAVVAMAEHNRRSFLNDPIPPSIVAQLGSAGLVAELALHPQGVAAAGALATEVAAAVDHMDVPVGLLFGRAGVALALWAAADAVGDDDLRAVARRVLPGKLEAAAETGCDVSHGLAGLGIAYLVAARDEPAMFITAADGCASRLVENRPQVEDELAGLPVGNPAHGVVIADGFAHGRAGLAYFLLAHAARTGDQRSRDCGAEFIDGLVAAVPARVALARTNAARPMAASWCQGLAGLGAALVRGAVFLDDDRCLAAAHNAAAGCLAVAPRVPLVTQCCGLAGVGELLLDLFLVTGEPHYWDDANGVLGLILDRSTGSLTAPRFPGSGLLEEASGWGNGTAGVLAFLRRLAEPATPRLWMADDGLLRQ